MLAFSHRYAHDSYYFVGLELWLARLGIGGIMVGASISSKTITTAGFVTIWFIFSVANAWFGISRAGYSFRVALPIFLLVFLLPAAVAVFVKWKYW